MAARTTLVEWILDGDRCSVKSRLVHAGSSGPTGTKHRFWIDVNGLRLRIPRWLFNRMLGANGR